MKSTKANSAKEGEDSAERLSIWQVAGSVGASFIGIQSRKNFERDVRHGRLGQFIIVGLAIVALIHAAIFAVVWLVTPPDLRFSGRERIVVEPPSVAADADANAREQIVDP